MAYVISVRDHFYDRRLPIFGDLWHLIAGLRYLPIVGLMWASYGASWPHWMALAVLDWAGWQALKRVHGKDWGWGVWERWLR